MPEQQSWLSGCAVSWPRSRPGTSSCGSQGWAPRRWRSFTDSAAWMHPTWRTPRQVDGANPRARCSDAAGQRAGVHPGRFRRPAPSARRAPPNEQAHRRWGPAPRHRTPLPPRRPDGQERPQQLVVQPMTGLMATELADETVAQQIQVANRVQDLVLDELVLVRKPSSLTTPTSSRTMALSRVPPRREVVQHAGSRGRA